MVVCYGVFVGEDDCGAGGVVAMFIEVYIVEVYIALEVCVHNDYRQGRVSIVDLLIRCLCTMCELPGAGHVQRGAWSNGCCGRRS